jgi:hypothetical protein
LLAGARQTLVKFRQAWLVYLGLVVAYLILLFVSLRTSASTPQAPNSVGGALQFAGLLVKDTFLPGAIGGPWRWYPLGGGSYALASTPSALTWLSMAVAAGVLIASVWYRKIAWRAWAILIGWIVLADMVPVIAGRINAIAPIILGLETRYLADATPILAICIGLAFWPVIGAPRTAVIRGGARSAPPLAAQPLRSGAAALVGVFVFGSVWSVQAYESVTTGLPARTYMENAAQALKLVPRGTNVLDRPVPGDMVVGLFGRFSLDSTVVGDLASGKAAGKLHWISRPEGTINKLYMFGTDGRLYPAWVYPTVSLPRTKAQGCWPQRHGQIVVRFWQPSTIYTGIMRIGYIWFAKYPSFVMVKYGNSVKTVDVLPGLNTAFVSESGGFVNTATVSGLSGVGMCVGDIEVGNLEPAKTGKPIPEASQ